MCGVQAVWLLQGSFAPLLIENLLPMKFLPVGVLSPSLLDGDMDTSSESSVPRTRSVRRWQRKTADCAARRPCCAQKRPLRGYIPLEVVSVMRILTAMASGQSR